MNPRKTKDIKSSLLKKGFTISSQKKHHEYYYLVINGKKQSIYTYFSHGKKEYNQSILSLMKKQLKFENTEDFENFIDCSMSKEEYRDMLFKSKVITP